MDFPGKFIPDFRTGVWGIQQERASFFDILENVVLLDEIELVAGDEISLVDQVRRIDGLRSEPQV